MKVNARNDVTEILIYEDIGEYFGGVTAAEFHRELSTINGPVLVRINSPGGDFHAAMAMRSVMAERGDVSVIVDGLAASAASILAMGGHQIEMAKGSHMMVHKPWTITAGNADELRDRASVLDTLAESMSEVYADRTGKTSEEVGEMLTDGDLWLDAGQAVSEGFADFVSDSPAIAAYIDHNVYPYQMPAAAKELPATSPAVNKDLFKKYLTLLRKSA